MRRHDRGQAVAFAGTVRRLRPGIVLGADLIAGLIYRPAYLLSMGMAAVLTWSAPQAWDWTKELTWTKVGVCVALLWISLAVMATQAYNPFIYFIF